MKKNLFLIAVVVIVIAIIGVFVFQKSKKPITESLKEPNSLVSNKENKEVTEEETTSQGGKEDKTLSKILSLGANISSLKYEMITTQQGKIITQKVWLKKNKMRTEMTTGGQTIVMLLDMETKTIYQYLPSQNTAFKMQSDKNTSESTLSPIEEMKSILNYNPVVKGTEMIDGKNCLVVEYKANGTEIKSWFWKEKGFPLKMEITVNGEKVVVEYKNIEFVDIPDSMFELPKGVKIMEM